MKQAPITCFNPRRFARLASAHWAEQRRNYSLLLLAVLAVYALLLLISLSISNGGVGDTSAQSLFFFAGLMLSGVVFAGLYFSALRRPESALLLLTRPASAFEKWLLALLWVLLLYPLLYTVCTLPINWLASVLGLQWHTERCLHLQAVSNVACTLPDPQDFKLFLPFIKYEQDNIMQPSLQISLMLLFAGAAGLALLGSIWFRRLAVLKTAVIAFVLFLISLFLAFTFNWSMGGLAGWSVFEPAPRTDTNALYWLANALFWLATPALLWLCALLALKERELA